MNLDLTATELAIAVAAGIVGAGYIAFILLPAIGAYARVWEKLAAGLLSLFILVTLLGVGGALGLAVVWSYDRYAG
jgi:ABC-type phosphate/phosphonate transport system permease subunit